ncbi:MAG: MobA/MobL family protein [Butyricicoccus sp.]|nr:MobA/MobL family protein [Butyricicoccus sp.]
MSILAIYHCNISNVSRAKGSTSCASLSYISGQAVKDERLDTTFNYGRKERVEVTGTIIPDSAPREYQNPVVLFNAIEKYETAENARTAKKIEVALPRELTAEQQQRIVEQYIQSNLTAKGYACTYAIHTDKDNNNPHAHILVANRQIDEKGQWAKVKTTSEFVRDKDGNKVPVIDEKTGEQKVDSRNRKKWKRQNVSANPLDKKETLRELRKQWAIECNKYLSLDRQIDHRSYAEQGKDKAPTVHEGYAARAMERRGEPSDRCQMNREIRAEERAIVEEQNENGAFMEVLKETDSRLQELKSVVMDEATERTYDFSCSTVLAVLERGRTIPALYHEGNTVVVREFEAPSKAVEFLRATKEKWDSFIAKCRERCRESHQTAHTNEKGKDEGKRTAETEKHPESLTERFKGWFADRAREKTERKAAEQEQARKRAEKRAETEAEKWAVIEKMKCHFRSYEYKARLEQLDFVAGVYRANREAGGDRELREWAFQRLGAIAGVKTREYDPQLGFYVSRDSQTIPLSEIEGAISKTKQSIYREKARNDEHEATVEKFGGLKKEEKKPMREQLKEAEKESWIRNTDQDVQKRGKSYDREER